MAVTGGSRSRQRAASEQAILDAAWELFAQASPDGASLRDVARDAGCTHTLVARYYGSKDGLEAAVAARLGAAVAERVDDAWAAEDPVPALLAAARAGGSCTRLLVRAGLGDLRPPSFPACLRAERFLDLAVARRGGGRRSDRRARLLAYAGAAVVLGWISYEEFLAPALPLDDLDADERDAAVAGVVGGLLDLAASPAPTLPRPSSTTPAAPAAAQPASGQAALLAAAVELFAAVGPASASVRDIARRAGANQGLIYRHFGSKERLLEAAIAAGSAELVAAAAAPGGYDFARISGALHGHSPAPRLLARTALDGVDVAVVRPEFPVVAALVDLAAGGPAPTGGRHRVEHRVAALGAVALALGSALWGEHLRADLALADDRGIPAAVATLAAHLVRADGAVAG